MAASVMRKRHYPAAISLAKCAVGACTLFRFLFAVLEWLSYA